MTEAERKAGYDDHRRAQRRAWLRLTHQQRLEWLDQAKRFAARVLEAAKQRAQRDDAKR